MLLTAMHYNNIEMSENVTNFVLHAVFNSRSFVLGSPWRSVGLACAQNMKKLLGKRPKQRFGAMREWPVLAVVTVDGSVGRSGWCTRKECWE